MAPKTRSEHGGKRPGSGRKPREPWENLWWSGFRGGGWQMMAAADDMRRAAEMQAAANACQPVNEARSTASMLGVATIRLRGSSRLRSSSAEAAAAARQDRARRARKQRHYRQRLATGLAVLHITTPLHDLTCALIESGVLTPEQALNRREVEHAISEMIADWLRRRLEESIDYM